MSQGRNTLGRHGSTINFGPRDFGSQRQILLNKIRAKLPKYKYTIHTNYHWPCHVQIDHGLRTYGLCAWATKRSLWSFNHVSTYARWTTAGRLRIWAATEMGLRSRYPEQKSGCGFDAKNDRSRATGHRLPLTKSGCEGHSGRLARECLGGFSTRKSAEGEGLRRCPLGCRRGEYLSNPAPESRIGAPGAFLGAESGSGVMLQSSSSSLQHP